MNDNYNNNNPNHPNHNNGPENNSMQNGNDPAKEQQTNTERPSYYYSYGPFKSSLNEESKATTTASSGEETSPVEISAPRPVRPYFGYSNEELRKPAAAAANAWEYNNPKKKSSLRSTFAAFLAGAVVVGSLMFASDKMDLFGGASAVGGNSPVAGQVSQAAGGGNGGVSTAALDSAVRPGNIAQIVNSASPAVVKITTYVNASNRSRSSFSTDDFFNYFFGITPRAPQSQGGGGEQRVQSGMGSGFIFENTGYILTNEHVIGGADEVEVEVQGYSKPFKAKVLGSEYSLDLAVIKIEPENGKPFSALELGSSDDINVGDWVVAIGNPYGFDHTVTVGVLSAKERPINIPDRQGTREYKHLLQTDASINPGNSGGPLLNLAGQVVGINTAVSSQAQGIGFAIPTSTVTSVLDNLKNNVKIPIPFVGVGIQDIQQAWVQELKLESTDGVLVGSVVQGGPAEKGDLQPYDVITEINGEKVKNVEAFREKIKSMKVGDKVTMTVVRNGTKLTTAVILGDQNKQ